MNNENELTAALATIEKLRSERDRLAAENVAMKEAIPRLKKIDYQNESMDDVTLAEQIGFNAAVMAMHRWSPKTPATDRIVAGIKADGVEWIEGNEPAEFGRYWVRYETDIGPQYCSAQWMEYNFCASSTTNIHKIWLADHSRSINSLRGVTHYTKLPAALEDQHVRECAK